MAEENKQLATLKKHLYNPSVKARIQDLLEDDAAFTASLISIVSESQQLLACSPDSIMSSALKAAALKLPIDKNLGFAYVVPYKNGRGGASVAQFQLGWKGYVQLALRSGMYKTIHCTEVYEDEFKAFNPITNELELNTAKLEGDRYSGKSPIGYYAYFELLSGFRKGYFMTVKQMDDYAQKYSQAYKYDKREKKKSSPWSTEFDAMAKGKMLKILLRTYGYLSIEMSDAFNQDDQGDQLVSANEAGETIPAKKLEQIPSAEVVDEKPVEKKVPAKGAPAESVPQDGNIESKELPSVFK